MTEFITDRHSQRNDSRRLEERGIVVFNEEAHEQPKIYAIPVTLNPEDEQGRPLDREATVSGRPHFKPPNPYVEDISDEDIEYDPVPPTHQNTPPTPACAQNSATFHIQIAPFLKWATESDEIPDDLGESDSDDYLLRILEAIHVSLEKQMPLRHAKLYKRGRETNQNGFESAHATLQSSAFQTEVLTSDHKQDDGKKAGSEKDKSHEAMNVDPIFTELFTSCNETIKELHDNFQQFISYFLPVSIDHSLTQKCWGAFESIVSVSLSYYL